jgi:hypothetical protein
MHSIINATAMIRIDLLPSVLLILIIHLRSTVHEDSVLVIAAPQPVLKGQVIDDTFEAGPQTISADL